MYICWDTPSEVFDIYQSVQELVPNLGRENAFLLEIKRVLALDEINPCVPLNHFSRYEYAMAYFLISNSLRMVGWLQGK